MTAGTPASKLCSPRESVPRRPSPWPDGSHAAGALMGFSPSRALSTTVRVRSLVSTHARSSKPLPRTPPGIQSSRLHSAIRTPTPGSRAQDPSIRASIERAHHRRAATQPTSTSRAPCAPAASPVPRPAGRRRTERLARAPSRRHPTPPCPRRRAPSWRVHAAGPRRRSFLEPFTSPAPCEAGWRPGPSRSSVWSPVTG